MPLPRLAAPVGWAVRLPSGGRGITELSGDLFGVTLSSGAADAICQRASDALAGPHCQPRDFRRHADGLGEQKTFGDTVSSSPAACSPPGAPSGTSSTTATGLRTRSRRSTEGSNPLGTQSKTGERFAQRALSAAGTCRLQRRSLFTCLKRTHRRPHPRRSVARTHLGLGDWTLTSSAPWRLLQRLHLERLIGHDPLSFGFSASSLVLIR